MSKGMNFIKGRKGEDMLVDFWAILAFAIVAVIFFLLFFATRNQSTQDTLTDFKNKDSSFMLDSFLRARYLNDETKTMSQIIAEDALNDDFSRTKNSFYYFYSGVDVYQVYNATMISICIRQHDSSLTHFNTIISTDLGKIATLKIIGTLNPCPDTPNDMDTEESKTEIAGIDNSNIEVRLAIRYDKLK